MSIRLSKVTSRMVHHNVPGLRYTNNDASTSIEVPFKLKQFSSDTKRKSAAYDRIAITCFEDFLKTDEVSLQGGDYVITNQGLSNEEWILVARLVEENPKFPGNPSPNPVQYLCDAYSCNVVFDILDKIVSQDPDTGRTVTGTVTVASGIKGSIASAEFFYQEPNNEPKDEFIVRLPTVIDVPKNSVLVVRPESIVYSLLQHDKYIVKYIEPDAQGVTIYRVGESEESTRG